MSGFVHLHLHSEYSLLDGACRIADIPKAAKEAGHSAVAITDHGVMYGVVAFYKACKAEGIKPIIGCEVYVASRTRFDKTHEYDSEYYHLVLLCKNEIGYRNLIYMVSKSFSEGFYSKPRIDIELLSAHSEGLIALSACMSGYIPKNILNGNIREAKRYAELLHGIFGNDNFYFELQNHGIDGQLEINRVLVEMSQELKIPLVATNDVHYVKRSDSETQAVLMCIQTNTTLGDENAMSFSTNEFYYKSTNEMERLFGNIPEALENTIKIAERCNFDFEFDKLYLPRFNPETGEKPEAYLMRLAYEALDQYATEGKIIYTDEHPESEYRERCEYELSVIIKMGYAEYYLIVRDFVSYAKSRKIPTGPGRGSGAGSLVAFLINITEVDSIKFNLLFERFLNPERISMPDFDIDFCYDRREEVLEYVSQRYGQEHVSQIITFGTLAARAAVRDVGRALGMSYADVDAVAKKIPQQLGIKLSEALEGKELNELYNSGEDVRRLLDTASAVEGMPRHISIHAAGVVITDKPVYEYVPLATSGDAVVTQFDMDTVAELGLLKFDFLALRYLTIIENTVKQIRESEPDFEIEKVGYDDEKTYALISSGNTGGVFQLESGGMKQMLISMIPKSLEDIMIAIALYRPGPMESIPRFMKSRHGKEPIEYKLPQLEKLLSDTCGCIVYQEQVMQICCEVAGFSLGHADIVRKAMSKKKSGQIEKEREAFLNGATERGCNLKLAEEVFEEMVGFAKYAFNKSHAAAYSIISYRTAYLKAHYPKQYFASLLTSVLGNIGKTAEYFGECSKFNILILPPDINESRTDFAVSGNNIRFGLLAIKNVGRAFVDKIIEERQNGVYKSFDSFVARMFRAGADINKRQVESLIKSGVFDSLGIYRSALMSEYEAIIDSCIAGERNNISGQIDMFSLEGSEEKNENALAYKYPDFADYDIKTKLMLEKESAGFYFSGHLLDDYSENLKLLELTTIGDIAGVLEDEDTVKEKKDLREGDIVLTAGIINNILNKKTRGGSAMSFIKIEDRYNEIELLVFPKQLERCGCYLDYDRAVAVCGEITVREDESAKLIVKNLYPLASNAQLKELTEAEKRLLIEAQTENMIKSAEKSEVVRNDRMNSNVAVERCGSVSSALEEGKKQQVLYLRVPDIKSDIFKKALNLIEIFEGHTEVVFYDKSISKYIKSDRIKVGATAFVLNELSILLGAENVVLK